MDLKITVWDYLVLCVILLISICIGLYHGYSQALLRLLNKFRLTKNDTTPKSLELNLIKTNDAVINDDSSSRQLNKTSEFIMANSTMRTIPIAFSLLASFYSATSLLGMPAEVYQYGIQYWMMVFGQMTCPLLGAFITGPFFAKLKVLSIFEYFEMRFDSHSVKLIGMTCYLIRNSISCIVYKLCFYIVSLLIFVGYFRKKT